MIYVSSQNYHRYFCCIVLNCTCFCLVCNVIDNQINSVIQWCIIYIHIYIYIQAPWFVLSLIGRQCCGFVRIGCGCFQEQHKSRLGGSQSLLRNCRNSPQLSAKGHQHYIIRSIGHSKYQAGLDQSPWSLVPLHPVWSSMAGTIPI